MLNRAGAPLASFLQFLAVPRAARQPKPPGDGPKAERLAASLTAAGQRAMMRS